MTSNDMGYSPSASYCFPLEKRDVFYGDRGTKAILLEAEKGRRIAYVDSEGLIGYVPTRYDTV